MGSRWDQPTRRTHRSKREEQGYHSDTHLPQLYPEAKSSQSYYGPEFQAIEKGRSASVGPIRYPQLPEANAWRRHPGDPWPGRVEDEYHYYKHDRTPAFEASRREFLSVARAPYPYEDWESQKNLFKTSQLLAQDTRLRANEVSAARAGFIHKYPTAYRSLDSLNDHIEQALSTKSAAANMRIEEQKYSERRGHVTRRLEKPGRGWADLTPSSRDLYQIPEEDIYDDLQSSLNHLYLEDWN